MTGTLSCDRSGADALVRAYQRAAVTAPVVRRVLQ
jgi:hypothetical protein